MKKLLLLTSLLSTPVVALEGDYTLVKSYEVNRSYQTKSLYRGNVSGKCYIENSKGNRESLSEVDCSDHGITPPETPVTTSIDTFIKEKCTTPKRGMNGKYYTQCELGEDYVEKQEYLRLKGKFEEEK